MPIAIRILQGPRLLGTRSSKTWFVRCELSSEIAGPIGAAELRFVHLAQQTCALELVSAHGQDEGA